MVRITLPEDYLLEKYCPCIRCEFDKNNLIYWLIWIPYMYICYGRMKIGCLKTGPTFSNKTYVKKAIFKLRNRYILT